MCNVFSLSDRVLDLMEQTTPTSPDGSTKSNSPACFVHTPAKVAASTIGGGRLIWQFVVVLAKAQITSNCDIWSRVFIENDVVTGDRVAIRSRVEFWEGLRVGNDAFIGPNVTFINDLFPRSRHYPERYLDTVIEGGASVGAGATVTRNIEARSLVRGNPARRVRYLASELSYEQY